MTLPVVEKALGDPISKIRAAGVRLAEAQLRQQPVKDSAQQTLRDKILNLATDTSADVQIQLALTLSLLTPDEKVKTTAASLAKNATAALAREAAAFAAASLDPVKSEPVTASKARPLTDEEKRRFEAGRTMYEATCLACHQQHGMGQPGLAPPLVDSEWVAGPETRLIRIVDRTYE